MGWRDITYNLFYHSLNDIYGLAVLIGQYKLYEGSGYSLANSVDTSQKGYLGTYIFHNFVPLIIFVGASTSSVPDTVDSPTWSTDVKNFLFILVLTNKKADNGLIFADNQYVSLPDFEFKASSPVFQGSMTVTLWIKLTQLPSLFAYIFRIFDASVILTFQLNPNNP